VQFHKRTSLGTPSRVQAPGTQARRPSPTSRFQSSWLVCSKLAAHGVLLGGLQSYPLAVPRSTSKPSHLARTSCVTWCTPLNPRAVFDRKFLINHNEARVVHAPRYSFGTSEEGPPRPNMVTGHYFGKLPFTCCRPRPSTWAVYMYFDGARYADLLSTPLSIFVFRPLIFWKPSPRCRPTGQTTSTRSVLFLPR